MNKDNKEGLLFLMLKHNSKVTVGEWIGIGSPDTEPYVRIVPCHIRGWGSRHWHLFRKKVSFAISH